MARFVSSLLILSVAVSSRALAAPSPVAKCEASKVLAAGKAAQAAVKCHMRARKTQSSVDATCLTKASEKLQAAFAKAETKAVKKGSACPTTSDSSLVWVLVDSTASSLAAELDDGSADTAACAVGKLKSSAKAIVGMAKSWARFGLSEDPEKLGRVLGKMLTKWEAGVANAEARYTPDCEVLGDSELLATIGTEYVTEIVLALRAGCLRLSNEDLQAIAEDDLLLADHLALATESAFTGPSGAYRCVRPGVADLYLAAFQRPVGDGQEIVLHHSIDADGLPIGPGFVERGTDGSVTIFRRGGGLRLTRTSDGTIDAVAVNDQGASQTDSALITGRDVNLPLLLAPDGSYILLPDVGCQAGYDLWLACWALKLLSAPLTAGDCQNCLAWLAVSSLSLAAIVEITVASGGTAIIGLKSLSVLESMFGAYVATAVWNTCGACIFGLADPADLTCPGRFEQSCDDVRACSPEGFCSGALCRVDAPAAENDECLKQCQVCELSLSPIPGDGCAGSLPPTEPNRELTCVDDFDNDCDGSIDELDDDCVDRIFDVTFLEGSGEMASIDGVIEYAGTNGEFAMLGPGLIDCVSLVEPPAECFADLDTLQSFYAGCLGGPVGAPLPKPTVPAGDILRCGFQSYGTGEPMPHEFRYHNGVLSVDANLNPLVPLIGISSIELR